MEARSVSKRGRQYADERPLRMFACEVQPVDKGFVASCLETQKRVFAYTSDGAMRKLQAKNDQWLDRRDDE